MSFAEPWALMGLLLVPLLWWVLRRARDPVVCELPTLMFLMDEEAAAHAPRQRRIDTEGVLALIALTLLVLAAAGPAFTTAAGGRRVVVVVSGGAPGGAVGYRERVDEVIDALRGTLRPADRLTVDWVPGGDVRAPRPTLDTLSAAARSAPAGLRIVISDRLPERVPADLRWVAVGNAHAVNLGVVAAAVVPYGDGHGLFVTIGNDRPRAVDTELTGLGRPVRLGVPGNGFASTTLALDDDNPRSTVAVATPPGDALEADDAVVVVRRPLRVRIEGLSDDAEDAVEDALAAVLGRSGFVRVEEPGAGGIDIVGAGGRASDGAAGLRLSVGVSSGGEGVRSRAGSSQISTSDPVVRDLRVDGVDWVFPTPHLSCGALDAKLEQEVLIGLAGDPVFPIVLRCGERIVFVPDPTVGEPAPADTPFWPLFFDNLLHERFPDAGVSVQGLLDPEASRLGHDVQPFDATWIAGAPEDRPRETVSARLPLMGIALFLILWIWLAPAWRARADRVSAARAA